MKIICQRLFIVSLVLWLMACYITTATIGSHASPHDPAYRVPLILAAHDLGMGLPFVMVLAVIGLIRGGRKAQWTEETGYPFRGCVAACA